MIYSILLLLPLFSIAAQAKNDWTKPCFQGKCSYDLPTRDNAPSGTLKIWGSPDAISDITPAAGWMILNCKPDAIAQDIRVVCSSDDMSEAGCDHLYKSIGPTGKIVRLPESCGKNAFARISREWVHKDQSIPAHMASRITRRANEAPVVRGLALDTNFAAVDPSVAGDVSFSLEGSTIPDLQGNAVITQASAADGGQGSAADRRGLSSFIKKALSKFTTVDVNVAKTLPVDFTQPFNVFTDEISCNVNGTALTKTASVKADVTGTVHAVIQVGLAAEGSIVPPKISDFGLFSGISGDFEGIFSLSGSATGVIDSGVITLLTVPLAGIEFPGVVTIGPVFKLNTQAKATLDATVALAVTMSYHIDNAKMFFPPGSDQQPSGGNFAPSNSPLKLSLTPSVRTTGSVEGHIIPQVGLEISAFGKTAQTEVHLGLDASAKLQLSIGASTTVTSAGNTSAGVNGCVDVIAGLDVQAGASGSFFNIFDQTATISLFRKNFNLFKKCFGTGAPKKRMVPQHFYKRAGIVCPVSFIDSITQLVDEALPAASIKAV